MSGAVRLMLAGVVLAVLPWSRTLGQASQVEAVERDAVVAELAGLTSFEQADDLAASYFSRDRIDKAIAVLEQAKKRFPAELCTSIRRLTTFYAITKQFDKVMDNWELGQSQGLFFRAESPLYEPLFGTDRYRAFLDGNRKLLEEARRKAKAEYDVVLPDGYDPSVRHPVFIVLHGNNISTAVMKPKWKLGALAGRFIVAFLQSSQVTGSESFVWDDRPTGRRDVAEYYAWLLRTYPIDPGRVLIGGFSGGAGMAIDCAVRGIIPAKAFVALCPGGTLPDRSELATLQQAGGRHLTGQVIAGERDDPEEARALVALLAEAGMQVELTVVPGLGHGFPADLAARLERAVGAVLQ